MVETTYDNVMVKMIHETAINTIFIPESAQSYHGKFYGIVRSLGKDNKLNIKVGDRVLFERHEGREICIDDEKLIVLRPDYLLAKVEE